MVALRNLSHTHLNLVKYAPRKSLSSSNMLSISKEKKEQTSIYNLLARGCKDNLIYLPHRLSGPVAGHTSDLACIKCIKIWVQLNTGRRWNDVDLTQLGVCRPVVQFHQALKVVWVTSLRGYSYFRRDFREIQVKKFSVLHYVISHYNFHIKALSCDATKNVFYILLLVAKTYRYKKSRLYK